MRSKAKDLLPRLGLVFLLQCSLTSPVLAADEAAVAPEDQAADSGQISEPVMSKTTDRTARNSMDGIDPEDLGVESQPETAAQPTTTAPVPTTESSSLAPQKVSASSTPATEPSAYTAEAVEHFNKGVECQHSGQTDRAIKEYKLAVQTDSRMAEAYSNLGMIYSDQKDYAKAKAALSKSLELKPNRAMTLNALATVLYASGKFQQAIDQWQLAVTADPQFASAYYNMGLAQEEQKKYVEAGNAYSRALAINPRFQELREHLGLPAYQEKPIQQPVVARAVPAAAPTSFRRAPAPVIEESNFEQYQPVRTNSFLAQAVARASSVCGRDNSNEITVHARYEQMAPPAHGVEFISNSNVAFSVSQAMAASQPKPQAKPRTEVASNQAHNRTTIAYRTSGIGNQQTQVSIPAARTVPKNEMAAEFGGGENVRMFVQPPRTN